MLNLNEDEAYSLIKNLTSLVSCKDFRKITLMRGHTNLHIYIDETQMYIIDKLGITQDLTGIDNV